MTHGKQTCKILKEIRQQIARANNIDFTSSPCTFEGDCTGTCPRCEAELQYLEQQIDLRRTTGKAIALLGISACLFPANANPQSLPSLPSSHTEVTQEKRFLITGKVKDCRETPLAGASIMEKGTSNGTLSNTEGAFSLSVSGLYPIVIQFIGYIAKEIPADSLKGSTFFPVILPDDNQLMGEVAVSDWAISTNEEEEPWFGMVDKSTPEFPGGMAVCMDYIQQTASTLLKKRGIAPKDIVQGRSIIQFTITEEGKVHSPKVVRSLHPVLDSIAIETIRRMPQWKPGSRCGKAVSTKYTIPVRFGFPAPESPR